MKRGESDEVGLIVLVDVVHSMANLLDVDGGLEGGFLCVVALESHAVLAVRDGVCRNGRVVASVVSLLSQSRANTVSCT